MKPCVESANAYALAYEHFKRELFLDTLTTPMLILTRDARIIGGHFAPNKWTNEEGKSVHEIAINANCMTNGDPVFLFGILIHEMVHLWQQENGKPTRGGYHNEEWMSACREVGLTPKGGGQTVSTEITPGGKAEAAIASLPEEAVFPWMSAEMVGGDVPTPKGPDAKPPVKSGIRSRFTCPICGLNAWAKPGANLVCGEDGSPLVEQVKSKKEED